MKLAEHLGIIEIAVAVALSFGISWVTTREDITELQVRMAGLEDRMSETIEVNKELSGTMNRLSVVLAGMEAEMRSLKEGVDRLREEK